jgi:nucleotide-sensitive chloride channel 1A
MPLTTIHTEPSLDSFTPLTEHQAQTPASFYGAKPILHYHCTGAHAIIPAAHRNDLPIFSSESTTSAANGSAGANGDVPATVVERVNIFVTSE